MSISDDTEKWACGYCTYLNFPSAQRCTICRSSKPWHLILAHGQDLNTSSTSLPPPTRSTSSSSSHPLLQSNSGNSASQTEENSVNYIYGGYDENNSMQNIGCGPCFDTDQVQFTGGGQKPRKEEMDIYKLASRADSMTNVANVSIGQQLRSEASWNPDANKWPCSACTYLNWPRAVKCTQCGKRRNSVASSPRNQQQQQRESSTPSNSKPGSGRNSRAPSKPSSGQHSPSLEKAGIPSPPSSHPPTSSPPPPQPAHSSTSSSPPPNTLLDSRIIAKKLQKWTCAACTYENWPKSTRCVMCYVPKGTVANAVGGASNSANRPNTPPSQTNSASRSPQPATSGTQTPAESGNEKKRSLSSGKEGGRKSPKNSSSSESVNSDHSIGAGAAASCSSSATAAAASSSLITAFSPTSMPTYIDQYQQQPLVNETVLEKTMRRLRKQLRDVDYLWLTALKSIASGGLADCCDPVEAYLAAGGDPARMLTNGEVNMLNRSIPCANFEVGHTLFHLAMRYRREDLLTLLLACSDRDSGVGSRQVQRVPCHMSPDSAAEIRRLIHASLRQRKGDMAAYFFMELATFSLPSCIYDLPPSIQAKLFDALLDRNVQKKLEEEYPIINWSVEVTDRLGSRLFALWNRMCGDCLLDSVLQATWGVFDSENSLRQALAESLSDAADAFYPRWREYETYLASCMHYTIEEEQFARDWELILELASKPGAALEQAHIFVLAHIIRRPIVVYGVRVVKSYFSGESIDYARFEGIYLPLLWEPSFCWRSPICLSYTPGHFTALVPMEPEHVYEIGAMAHVREFPQQARIVYLPLQDSDGRPLPVHFLNANERGHEQQLLRSWLDVCLTEGGLWCCKMRILRVTPAVQQMIEDWLDYYRRLAQLHQAANTALATRYNDANAPGVSGSHHHHQLVLKSNRAHALRKATSLSTVTVGGDTKLIEGGMKTEPQQESAQLSISDRGVIDNRIKRSPEPNSGQATTIKEEGQNLNSNGKGQEGDQKG